MMTDDLAARIWRLLSWRACEDWEGEWERQARELLSEVIQPTPPHRTFDKTAHELVAPKLVQPAAGIVLEPKPARPIACKPEVEDKVEARRAYMKELMRRKRTAERATKADATLAAARR